ncbi:unnamed protein product [Brachionus calyciflorus]|uniref:Uncharacterized protein n=1 Tax=Brachionus calyciflorus TaxID=104777 RepID=A0A814FQP4_9BILA|nr:unnamed protein product [Brachionus calyciflorus]
MLNQKVQQVEKADRPKMSWSNLFKKQDVTNGNPEPQEKTLQKIEAAEAMTAFTNEISNREKRKKNIVIVEVEESRETDEKITKKDEDDKINEILEKMIIDKNKVKSVTRINNKSNNGKPGPILMKIDSEESKFNVLKQTKELRDDEKYKNIFVNADLTPAERLEQKILRD